MKAIRLKPEAKIEKAMLFKIMTLALREENRRGKQRKEDRKNHEK